MCVSHSWLAFFFHQVRVRGLVGISHSWLALFFHQIRVRRQVGVSRPWLAFFFYQIRVRRLVGVSWSWEAGLSARSTVIWRGLNSLGLVLEMPEIDYLWCRLVRRQLSLIWHEMRRGTVLSAQSLWNQLNFKNIFWPFYSHIWDQIGSDKLCGESSWLVEKGTFFFNCKLIFTFPPDGCAEPTCAVKCFIHFFINHRQDNIRLILPFFNWNVRSWYFYLVINLFFLLVGEFICDV